MVEIATVTKFRLTGAVDAFLTQLVAVIRQGRLLPSRRPVLVAVSGGLDSMTLLHALAELRKSFGWQLAAAHFNHQLRGRAANADERLVLKCCRDLQVPCHVARWDANERAVAIKAMGVEMAARAARHRFLGATARQVGAARIALAHHADDQVELFFVRLLRGAGSRGLGGMRNLARHGAPLNAWLARPLLGFRRTELKDWARAHRIKFREDASNLDPRFVRNRIRTELLPMLRDRFGPAVEGTVLRTMATLTDEADWLRIAADEFLTLQGGRVFARLHPALQRQVLVRQLEKHGVAFDTDMVEHLRREDSPPITAPGGQAIARSAAGEIVFIRRSDATTNNSQATVEVRGRSGRAGFGDVRFHWSRRSVAARPKFTAGCELFDADKIGSAITLRHWRPGDRFQPSGHQRPAKLQDLFTNAKVPRARRHQLTVAVTGHGDIFWVEGLRIGELFKLTGTTQSCLVWRWQPVRKTRSATC